MGKIRTPQISFVNKDGLGEIYQLRDLHGRDGALYAEQEKHPDGTAGSLTVIPGDNVMPMYIEDDRRNLKPVKDANFTAATIAYALEYRGMRKTYDDMYQWMITESQYRANGYISRNARTIEGIARVMYQLLEKAEKHMPAPPKIAQTTFDFDFTEY